MIKSFISAGIIFCHFNRRKTKNLKNDDLPIPPGGKGLNDKTRPLNDLGTWFHFRLRSIFIFAWVYFFEKGLGGFQMIARDNDIFATF